MWAALMLLNKITGAQPQVVDPQEDELQRAMREAAQTYKARKRALKRGAK